MNNIHSLWRPTHTRTARCGSTHTYEIMAEANFEELRANPYPGRGIIIGKTESGDAVIVYWIMGRSPNSQNRVFCSDESTGRLWTKAADEAKVEDPSLIIYNAMLEQDKLFMVSNGDQTDTIATAAASRIATDVSGSFFREGLQARCYEPDGPHYTPRISGVLDLHEGHPLMQLSILKKGGSDPNSNGADCSRQFFEYSELPAGFGYGITTYAGDGNVLPIFSGEPKLYPLFDSNPDAIADKFWNGISEKNRVSLAVKLIDVKSGKTTAICIRNRFSEK